MTKNSVFIGVIACFAGVAHAQALTEPLLNLYNAKNYRQVVDLGTRGSVPGGFFYAHRVLTECKAVREADQVRTEQFSQASKKQPSRQTSDAIESLNQRCAPFSNEELSDTNLKNIRSYADANQDPLFDASKTFIPPTNNRLLTQQGGNKSISIDQMKNNRQAAVHKLSVLKDPLLVQDLGMRLVLGKDEKTGRTTFIVDGKNVPLNSQIDMGQVINLVPCELGLKCDITEFSVAFPCSNGVDCNENRYAVVRKSAANSGKNYDEMLLMARKIAYSIKYINDSGRALK